VISNLYIQNRFVILSEAKDLLSAWRQFYIYIMASKSRVLYTGITNNLQRRVWDHKHDELPGFTRKYRIHRLVYYETFKYVGNAIAREKHIKG
jgi:putative endonuclease